MKGSKIIGTAIKGGLNLSISMTSWKIISKVLPAVGNPILKGVYFVGALGISQAVSDIVWEKLCKDLDDIFGERDDKIPEEAKVFNSILEKDAVPIDTWRSLISSFVDEATPDYEDLGNIIKAATNEEMKELLDALSNGNVKEINTVIDKLVNKYSKK